MQGKFKTRLGELEYHLYSGLKALVQCEYILDGQVVIGFNTITYKKKKYHALSLLAFKNDCWQSKVNHGIFDNDGRTYIRKPLEKLNDNYRVGYALQQEMLDIIIEDWTKFATLELRKEAHNHYLTEKLEILKKESDEINKKYNVILQKMACSLLGIFEG